MLKVATACGEGYSLSEAVKIAHRNLLTQDCSAINILNTTQSHCGAGILKYPIYCFTITYSYISDEKSD